MHLALNNNVFFEFVPFDQKNFDAEGNMVEEPEAYMIHEIEENKDYAILISTNAGAWRYAIGDTVKLVDRERSEIIITGRSSTAGTSILDALDAPAPVTQEAPVNPEAGKSEEGSASKKSDAAPSAPIAE